MLCYVMLCYVMLCYVMCEKNKKNDNKKIKKNKNKKIKKLFNNEFKTQFGVQKATATIANRIETDSFWRPVTE